MRKCNLPEQLFNKKNPQCTSNIELWNFRRKYLVAVFCDIDRKKRRTSEIALGLYTRMTC